MLFKLVEDSSLHYDVAYLMAQYGQPAHVAIETAVRLQAQLTRRLDHDLQVSLWGGPPFGKLHFTREVERVD